MNGDKIKTFMTLAGQRVAPKLHHGTPEQRKLGAQLLLSEVLEYVIDGLGVIPEVGGVKIEDADNINYHADESRKPSSVEMLDGLADTAYTMYWNAHAFGVPLEEGFELVCDNNLEKFVKLEKWSRGEGELVPGEWHCNLEITWPPEVVAVRVVDVDGEFYAVGKDARGKVRKPSSYKSVDLSGLVAA